MRWMEACTSCRVRGQRWFNEGSGSMHSSLVWDKWMKVRCMSIQRSGMGEASEGILTLVSLASFKLWAMMSLVMEDVKFWMSSQYWWENLILRNESWLPVRARCSIIDLIINSKKNLWGNAMKIRGSKIKKHGCNPGILTGPLFLLNTSSLMKHTNPSFGYAYLNVSWCLVSSPYNIFYLCLWHYNLLITFFTYF